jgi:transmembrane sensor
MKQEDSAPLSDSVRAEAAAWVARIHSSSRSPALEAGMRKWLEADPAHARAFEIATEAWEIGGSVRSSAMPRTADPFVEAPSRKLVTTRRVAIAATVLALAGTVIYLQREPPLIATAVGEQRMLTLNDGTRIFLNTDTRLFVKEDAAQRGVRLENGEAWFDVAVDPRRPFVVTAGDQKVVALGTDFVVRRESQQLTVTLVEGKVGVSPAAPSDKPTRVLTPGQRLTFVGGKPPRLDEPAMHEVTAWRRGEVIFDKTRLQDAAAEMNRYSEVKLIIDGPQAADIRLSGIFRAGDSARFAQAVGVTYHLAIVHEAGRIRISDPAVRN